MFILVGPPGGNVDYIGNVLAHNKKFKQFTPPSNLYEQFNHKNNQVIQVIADQQFSFLIINWFVNVDLADYEDWVHQQLEKFKSYFDTDEQRLCRAVLSWFYSLKNKKLRDNKDIANIKNKFMFDCFYMNDYGIIRNEFAKYNIKYSKETFKKWQNTQKLVFENYKKIKKNVMTPNNLNYFWHKGIALGMHGEKNNLSEEETWEFFNG